MLPGTDDEADSLAYLRFQIHCKNIFSVQALL